MGKINDFLGGIRADSLVNLVTGLSTFRDKRSGDTWEADRRELLEYGNIYTSSDVAARIVNLPASEMTREWIDITVGTEDDADKETAAEQAVAADDYLDRLKAKRMFAESLVWASVYGGALIQMGIDDGHESDQPVDENNLRGITALRVFSRRQFKVEQWYDEDPADLEKFGKPKVYRMYWTDNPSGVNTNDILVHESRVLRFDGVLTPSEVSVQNEGFGDSVYVRTGQVIRDYVGAYSGVGFNLRNFGQFIYRLNGLSKALTQEGGTKQIQKRLEAVDMGRSMIRAILLDAEKEDAQYLNLSWGGLPEVLNKYANRLAQAAEMPLTLLEGTSPGGLNATGDSDIRLYYDRLAARQELEMSDQLDKLIGYVFKASEGPSSGADADWSFTFNPLWQMSDAEVADVRKTYAEVDQLNVTTGVYDADEARTRYIGDEFSSEIVLDESRDAEEAQADQILREMPVDLMAETEDG